MRSFLLSLSPGRLARCAFAVGTLLLAAGANEGMAQGQAPVPPPAPVVESEVSFDFSQGIIRLDVDLGAPRAARLALDTGNLSSTLDLDAAKALGLAPDPAQKKKMGSAADAPEYFPLVPEHVRLGGTTFTGNHVFAVAPITKALEERYGITCDGTMGVSFFKGRVVQIDYPARKLRVLATSPAATAAAAPVPILWRPLAKGTPPVVTVDRLRLGGRTIAAQVDTFFRGALIVFPGKVSGLDTLPVPTGTAATPYAGAELPAGRLRTAAILGGITRPADGTVYLAGKDARIPQTEVAAILGSAFFQGAILTLDLKENRLFASPSHSRTESNFPLRPSGAGE